MAKKAIPTKTKFQLWRKSGGRCQYAGCNEPLWKSGVTQEEFNTSNIAHIYGEKPGSARYDDILSPKLATSLENLMLLCYKCHHLVDEGFRERHHAYLLIEMKKKHEERIEFLTGLTEEKSSHILLYGAKVGQHTAPVHWDKVFSAMLPNWYPAEKPGFELSLGNSSLQDHEEKYWEFESAHLQRQFATKIRPRLEQGDINHLSVFAFAPQPLLIELGRLISDINNAEVYQLHRQPASWEWQPAPKKFSYTITSPSHDHPIVALNLSLSATITNDRIHAVLGDEVSIWTITITQPHNDFIRSKAEVELFQKELRVLLDSIKKRHGQNTNLHIFPAVPLSLAIEMGRVWMPKADLPIKIYDQNRKSGGFTYALTIS